MEKKKTATNKHNHITRHKDNKKTHTTTKNSYRKQQTNKEHIKWITNKKARTHNTQT